MNAAAHRKALVKLLRQASGQRHLWEVFGDFIAMAALSISNVLDHHQREAREAEYMRVVGRYGPGEVALFPQMLGELVDALEAEPHDALGMVFGELELGNAARGQFFTPFAVCRLMADLTIGDGDAMREQIERQGFVSVTEPAVGAGAMIVALAMAMQAAGFNYQQQLHVTAIDVDARAAHMAYLQFSLLHIPAVVIVGNALSREQREVFYTPAHILGAWPFRLGDCTAPAAPLVVTPPAEIHAPGAVEQLPLFAEAS